MGDATAELGGDTGHGGKAATWHRGHQAQPGCNAQSLGTQRGGDPIEGTWQQSWDLTPRACCRGHYGQAGTRHVGHGDKAGTWHVGHDAGGTAGDTPARQEVTCGARHSRHGGKAGKRCWGQRLWRGHALSLSLSHLLGTVPGLRVPQESGGTGGQGQAEGEAQHGVDRPDEVQAGVDLALQLGTRCHRGGDKVGGGTDMAGGGDRQGRSPAPACRRCERRPAGSAGPGSAPSKCQGARCDAAPRNQPGARVAPATTVAGGRTSGCGRTDGRSDASSSAPPSVSPASPQLPHQWAGQFMGLRERVSVPAAKENMWGL